MLTKVYLEGAMGAKFGREWEFSISSPREALRMIEANKPGLMGWIKASLAKFSRYRVVCEYEDGRTEELDNDSYLLDRKLKSVRFVPIIEGAGNLFKVVLGVVLIVVGVMTGFTPLINIGASMLLSGVIGMLSPQPTKNDAGNNSNGESKSSNYFDGPVNTTQQGVPVQLIYGDKVMVGSHPISVRMSIDQLM